MKLRALSACVAVLVFAVACANTAQQPETQPAVVPTPSMELLDTRSYPVRHITVLLPGGIISDEVQSELWEYEATYLDGKPLPPPYNLKYNYGYSTSLGVHFIEIVQEIYLPKEAYVQSLIAYGPPPPLPGSTPEPWDFPFPLDIPFGGPVLNIIYKGEWALLSGLYGRFKVGEDQTDTFRFLFEQLGRNRAIIAESEAYEEYWRTERAKWLNNPTLTPVPTTKPATLVPLPPMRGESEPLPSLVPPGEIHSERR